MCEMWTLLPQTSKSSLSEVHRRYLHHSAKQFPGFLLETGHINTLNYSLRKTDSRVFIGNWLLQPSAYHRSTFQYLRRTVFYTIKVCIYLPVQEHPPPQHTHTKCCIYRCQPWPPLWAGHFEGLPFLAWYIALSFTRRCFNFATQETVWGSLVVHNDTIESYVIIF